MAKLTEAQHVNKGVTACGYQPPRTSAWRTTGTYTMAHRPRRVHAGEEQESDQIDLPVQQYGSRAMYGDHSDTPHSDSAHGIEDGIPAPGIDGS
eukprot:scaffold148_cov371-Prasinococcus_capsulatus_cf.AAC.21